MEITVKLPSNLSRDVLTPARAKKKSGMEIIKNAVWKAAAEDAEVLERLLTDCADAKVLVTAGMK